ncbi:uncharacterized protein LOC132275312 [Cornus florida]|uniref:uncharacterized protein LOC132275312 n=1 Tax=Cornus florida TaxID=4283 RepID=UPI00289D29DA|nr:uncharacterized protein LOC132275312 [Cornus florida]
MSNKSPIFPISEPHHFSDYGFDPQIDYFQVLEEARKHKVETSTSSIDALHFNLKIPISKEESKKIKRSKKRWWRSALLFFRWKWTAHNYKDKPISSNGGALRGSISGPVYFTESRSGSASPYRTTSRPSSGPLALTMTPSRKGEVEVPYTSLREMDVDQQQRRVSTSALPIYLVP